MLNSPLEIVHVSCAAVPPGAVYIANFVGETSRARHIARWAKVISPIKLRPEPGPGSPLSGNIVSAKCCSRNAFAPVSRETATRLLAKACVVDDTDDASRIPSNFAKIK